jgi:hypothetical protein
MPRHSRVRAFLALTTLAVCACLGTPFQAEAATTPSPATQVAKLTGPGSINATDSRYSVYGTDLGIMWDNGAGQVLAAFGDTYGKGWGGNGAGPSSADWRCNTLARSADTNLADGMSFTTMVQDRPGHAKQLLDCKQVDNDEDTVIPTAGVSVGGRSYLHYMSVNHWGSAGNWYTNYSGVAYSDDNGQTWQKDPGARWQNTASWDSQFQMAAYARRDGFVYMYATPNGRFGGVHLARVPEQSVLDKASYRYWDGGAWQTAESAAAPIVAGPVGELSVQYNQFAGKWLMMYLNESRAAIVLREADTATGPWSGERVVVRASDYPGLYGGFMHPWSSGPDLYFTMSQWAPYNVFLMHTRLTVDGAAANLLGDPGLEEQATGSVASPWQLSSGTGGVDRGLGNAHSGANNGWLRSNTGWNDLHQTLALQPNRRYRLSGWIRTSGNNTAGYFGVRTTSGTVIAEQHFASLAAYTQLDVVVNVGPDTQIQAYAGMWASGDTWIQVDDLALTAA